MFFAHWLYWLSILVAGEEVHLKSMNLNIASADEVANDYSSARQM